MLKIPIPGGDPVVADCLVLDYNGTVALDGTLLPGVADSMQRLSTQLEVHVLTADTHGTVAEQVAGLPVTLAVIGKENQDEEKLRYIRSLAPRQVVAVGNGRNDCLMLREAGLGIGLIQKEGAYAKTLLAADVLCTSINDVFELLLLPARIQATLRC